LNLNGVESLPIQTRGSVGNQPYILAMSPIDLRAKQAAGKIDLGEETEESQTTRLTFQTTTFLKALWPVADIEIIYEESSNQTSENPGYQ
jgi:hypothetical protein